MKPETPPPIRARRSGRALLAAAAAATLLATAAPAAAQASGHGASRGHAAPAKASTAVDVASDGALLGEAVPLGRGTMRTYVLQRPDGSTEIGVALSDGALDDLPGDGAPGGVVMPDGHSTFEWELAMPAAHATPFRHATVDWNPAGHEPPGIYDLAHFDFHFYYIESEVRRSIHPGNPAFGEKAARLPDADLIPERFFLPMPDAVPMMGVHWLDAATPELNGTRFTHTYIVGSWDGELAFAEPMITLDYLRERGDATFALPPAARTLPDRPLPNEYFVRWDPGAREHRVGVVLPAGVWKR